MKLCLKSGETVRLQHDGDGAFSVYVADGIVHVTALARDLVQNYVILDTPRVNIEKSGDDTATAS